MLYIINRDVQVTVSDPWDFVTEYGVGPFIAKIVEIQSVGEYASSAILRLSTPITHIKEEEYFIAQVRHIGEYLDLLTEGKEVLCNLTKIPASQVYSNEPFNLGWWRGGIALIATLKLA